MEFIRNNTFKKNTLLSKNPSGLTGKLKEKRGKTITANNITNL